MDYLTTVVVWKICIGFVLADGDYRLTSTIVVDAPRPAVWKAFTTKEGAQSWMVAHAEIDMKIGGLMRTHYDPKGKLGDDNTIENTILCFDPERMLSIKNTRAPKNVILPKKIQGMWTVIYFEDAGANKTKVSVVGLGYGDDEESQKLRVFFQRGNEITLQRLQEYFAKQKN